MKAIKKTDKPKTDTRGAPGLKSKHSQAASIVAQMSLEEKAAQCSGANFWHLEPNIRLDLPSVMVTDGPHGLRKQRDTAGQMSMSDIVPATCFPTASALASSWNTTLLTEVGVALAEQCVAENVAVLLGPGVNIKRHPLCGRNFEYFSEDPLLTGELAAALIQGIQSQGVGTSIKHYAVNNQETGRMTVDAIVDERTLREIYLRGFEIAIKKSQPWTVMCAYNRVNGTYCSENYWLLNEVLRDEWGYEGLVVTDWGATNDRVRSISAGLDLEMPGNGGINDQRVSNAVESGQLLERDLDRAVTRIVSLTLMGTELFQRSPSLDKEAHHLLARRAAAECAVLLKNDEHLLPLATNVDIAVIGAFAKQPRYQGGGSSHVNPTQIDCAWDAIGKTVGDAGDISYAEGYDPTHSEVDPRLLEEAVATARNAEVVIVFAGLPEAYETEGFDRAHMRMPEQHNRMIEAVCETNPNTVVVLSNGAPVEMPWVKGPQAILECYLGGQAGGGAIADLLFGRGNPSGKLAETFPLQQSDVLADAWFPGTVRQVQYREGLYVGYRYFDSAEKSVLFPFGHGLSYTTFDYADLSVSRDGGAVQVVLDITNSGKVEGSEVVQLYVHDVESSVYRPEQELRAFTKVKLAPGQTSKVTFSLDKSAFAVYDTEAHDWVVEAGIFEIRVGSSSRDIRSRERVDIQSERQLSESLRSQPRVQVRDGAIEVSDDLFASMLGRFIPAPESSRPYHINSTVGEVAETWLGKKLQARVHAGLTEHLDVEDDETHKRMLDQLVNYLPLRGLVVLSGGKMSFKSIVLLVAMLNKRFLLALRLLFSSKDPW